LRRGAVVRRGRIAFDKTELSEPIPVQQVETNLFVPPQKPERGQKWLVEASMSRRGTGTRIAMELEAGTETRTIRGSGWTEKEALDEALRADESEYGHGEGYGGGRGSLREVLRSKMVKEPRKATRVKVEKATVRKGPVEKKFVIEKRWGLDRQAPIDNDRRMMARYDNQGDVLRAAKELVLEYGTEVVITLKAFCVGDTRLAVLTPEGSQRGEWMFECDFRS
jgi:hypothetical protein